MGGKKGESLPAAFPFLQVWSKFFHSNLGGIITCWMDVPFFSRGRRAKGVDEGIDGKSFEFKEGKVNTEFPFCFIENYWNERKVKWQELKLAHLERKK
jgi:hypothetical protein